MAIMAFLYRNTYREWEKENCKIKIMTKELVCIGYMVDGCVYIAFTRLGVYIERV